MGFEILVTQRSDEWFELRNSVSLTASQFGDALGVGRGRPAHFLQSIITKSDDKLTEVQQVCSRNIFPSMLIIYTLVNMYSSI